MNEIELLRQLRAGLPAAKPESRAAARAGLMARIEHAKRPAGTGTPSPWWRRPRLLAIGGVSLAALLIALPIGIFGGSGKVQPAVGQVLRQVARVAASQAPVAPGPGQYLFTRSKDAYLQATGYSPRCRAHPCDRDHPWEATDEWSVLVPADREAWIPFDDSRRGRVRVVAGKPRFVSADQRAGWVAAGSPPLPRAGRVEDTALSGVGFLDPSELPTDPARLRQRIEGREIRGVDGPPGEAETFTLIGDMLREGYLPAAVRAAIYRLTAELPGVELLGEVRDPVGRPGTGIAFTDRKRGTRHELIFDSATSALLGERESIVESGAYGFEAPPGTPIGYAAYLESKVVDSVGRGAPAGAGAPDRSVGCYDRASLHTSTTIVHGVDPIAACAELWREGVVDARRGPASPHLVACAYDGSSVAHVFPGSGPAVCRRLDLVPLPSR
ncbi:MAG TPA: CU044_5270 family protein [Solirubrobacterales bacterium]|jgi:hypothetical protein|nr:CU044_5270 family protein [Solirubrobacterales bacterium]